MQEIYSKKKFTTLHKIWYVYKTVFQIENLQEQLRDKEKQMSSLRERVKSLQTDTSNTDTALTTLEDSLAEKVRITSRGRYNTPPDYRTHRWCTSKWHRHGRNLESEHLCLVINISCSLYMLSFWHCVNVSTSKQERIIERLKEQRDREEREKAEELDNSKKELRELKEKVSMLQGDLSDREVRDQQNRKAIKSTLHDYDLLFILL